ncbi:hypothetical protein N7519_001546 [Penicillium mononematosum]|uniref:uncharacterized protein n=1 Tax=Penicillium mononematosum TaxID=268346 RepID=UPI002547CBF6|nr:uncharacterized protein N7519_001546 [Penicillium mononematosum]KAJ6191525.1 hypothetical protein N7519_001546 [Penicillium mononematosum]
MQSSRIPPGHDYWKASCPQYRNPMERNQQIDILKEEGLEESTLVRVRCGQRPRMRAIIVHEAQDILDSRLFLDNLDQYLLSPAYLE